ncbi:MAG: hypothetical protein EA353_07365 [Puniceicoccaceae bacterium]|nr:MAG: hypothetical protein EA353_07365 [Puniceicoccaceae bacterium]
MRKILKPAFLLIAKTFLSGKSRLFLVGDGRSGTTWVSQALNFDGNFPEIFEPFHGRRHLKLSDSRLYLNETDFNLSSLNSTKYIRDIEQRLFIRRCLATCSMLSCHGFVIKDISVHMILKQLFDREQVLIYIIRNPISVALSKERFGSWQNESDLTCLAEYSTSIGRLSDECFGRGLIKTEFLSYILTWSLLNRIALTQLEDFGFPVVFYENLLRHPETSFEEVFQLAGLGDRFIDNKSHVLRVIYKESKTTIEENTIGDWKNDAPHWVGKISSEDLSKAYEILKIFGLYQIYEDTLMPKVSRSGLAGIKSSWN